MSNVINKVTQSQVLFHSSSCPKCGMETLFYGNKKLNPVIRTNAVKKYKQTTTIPVKSVEDNGFVVDLSRFNKSLVGLTVEALPFMKPSVVTSQTDNFIEVNHDVKSLFRTRSSVRHFALTVYEDQEIDCYRIECKCGNIYFLDATSQQKE